MDVPFRVDHPRGPLLNEEQVREMYEGREMTMQEIADELVCPPSRVARTMKAYGISSRRAIPRSKINSGDQNPNWKGGRHMLSGTYVWIHFPAHPCANGSGYVAEHVAVAYEKYGYAAPPGHVVHHINMRHTDNRPENLVYMPKRLHHMVHRQFEQVVPILLERGILTFDLEHGYYVTGTEPKVLRWDEWRVCELEDCGKEFLVKTKRPHQRFCSVQCVAANRRGRQRTEWAVR